MLLEKKPIMIPRYVAATYAIERSLRRGIECQDELRLLQIGTSV